MGSARSRAKASSIGASELLQRVPSHADALVLDLDTRAGLSTVRAWGGPAAPFPLRRETATRPVSGPAMPRAGRFCPIPRSTSRPTSPRCSSSCENSRRTPFSRRSTRVWRRCTRTARRSQADLAGPRFGRSSRDRPEQGAHAGARRRSSASRVPRSLHGLDPGRARGGRRRDRASRAWSSRSPPGVRSRRGERVAPIYVADAAQAATVGRDPRARGCAGARAGAASAASARRSSSSAARGRRWPGSR